MSNQIDTAEEDYDDDLEPILFNHEQRYVEEVLPRLKELIDLLKDIGIDFLIQLCYAHIHPQGGECQHGAAVLVGVDPAKSPVSMTAAALIAQMSGDDAYRVMQVSQSARLFFEKLQSGEIVLASDDDQDPWQAAAPMN